MTSKNLMCFNYDGLRLSKLVKKQLRESRSSTRSVTELSKPIQAEFEEVISLILEEVEKHKTTIRREKKGEPSFMEVVPLDKIREILNG